MSDANDGEEQGQALGELIEALRDRDDVRLPEVLPEQGEPEASWLARTINVLINLIRTQREIPLPDVPEGGFGVTGGEDDDDDDALPEMDTVPFTMTGAGVNVHQHAGMTGIVSETPTANEEQPIAGVEAGTGVAVMNDVLVGRIPSHVYSIGSTWTHPMNGVFEGAGYVVMDLRCYDQSHADTVGIPSPVFGAVVGIVVNTKSSGLSGTVTFTIKNLTTGLSTGTPTTTAMANDTSEHAWAATTGLAVSLGDKLAVVMALSEANTGDMDVSVTLLIQEQCAYVVTGTLVPDATGVYVRNGQYGGKPAFERVDGAYWLFWASIGGAWIIATSKSATTPANSWGGGPTILGTYSPLGTYTGTATVAAQAD